jgi:cold-inducible RNA-binding protein
LFYFSIAKRQKQSMMKTDLSLKNQETSIHQGNLILFELRRTNQLLAELAGIELLESNNEDINKLHGSSFEPMESSNGQYKLYVGNIDYAATESELGDHFARFGQVEFVNIPINRYTGRARGFGFVTFGTKEDAERAMTLNGSEFKGRQIQVNFAKEREIA